MVNRYTVLTRQKYLVEYRKGKRKKKMNPLLIRDDRKVVWTVSLSHVDRYCLYVDGALYVENLTLDDFWPIYKNIAQ